MPVVANGGRLVAAFSLTLLGCGAPSISLAQGLPGGSYSHTCNNVQMVSGVLEATCQRADGSWTQAALPNPGACNYGVVNSNGALVCASQPASNFTTTQFADGIANVENTCNNGQKGYFLIATNNNETNGLALILAPGQTVQLVVMKGSSYIANCGAIPTDRTRFQYFNIATGQ